MALKLEHSTLLTDVPAGRHKELRLVLQTSLNLNLCVCLCVRAHVCACVCVGQWSPSQSLSILHFLIVFFSRQSFFV